MFGPVCVYIPGHIIQPVLHSSAPFSAFPPCSPARPKSIHCFRSVNSTAGSELGHPNADQNPDKIGWTLKGFAADGDIHTHTHKEGNNEVPPEFPHDKHHTKSPWRLGKEKLSLSFRVIPHSVSNLSPFSDYPSFFFITPSFFPPDSILPSLLAGMCVCVDVL